MSADPTLVSDLVFFRAVVRTGSFIKASAHLSVTQSAVSQRVARLEQRLGMVLLRRHRSGIRLTPQGERLFSATDDGLALIDASISELQAARTKRPVVISCVPSLALEWLTPKTAEFYRVQPEIEVTILADMGTVLEYGDQEDVDISIRYSPNVPSEGTVVAEFSEEVFPVLSPNLLASLEADAVESVTLLHDALPWPEPSAASAEWDIWKRRGRLPFDFPTRDLFVNLVQLCYRAAAEDVGIAMGRKLVVRRQMGRGALVPMPGATSINELRYYLVTQRRNLRPDVKIVLDWLISQFQKDLHELLE
ncbi:LysR substrate-binding domain-containing protein [Devosia sp. YIM 151766]|uniref:LysR family transcriptional regulator n=1 Tax=Devosia sp. YIM 151766 TaxID=3017325 RepID=UPI00255C3485|nr:LysR family transcriptional regulator [Devosia sp. YIM 151766]WIY53956.1 LysR substrate-binding domain-containing protein [Devosia sp. YIM 151766]